MEKTRAPHRMEIWYANLPLNMDSCVQGGSRPVVIISNNICNELNQVITVIPMTRQMKKLNQPSHTVIDAPNGGQSLVLAEQIITIDKKLLDNRIGKVMEYDLEKVETAILEQLGMSEKEK